METLKNLLQQYERTSAKNEKDYTKLSLLYQYFDDYKKEQPLIESAIKAFPDNSFFKKRQSWHNQKLFHPDHSLSKLIPRTPINLEQDPQKIPSNNILENMCIVIISHSNISLMIECIESIKATRNYAHIPICIFDVGLSEDHKHILQKMFDVKIRHFTENKHCYQIVESLTYNQDSSYLNKNFQRVLYCHCRMYYDLYFPEFKYFLCLEPDMWIYDDRIIDQIVSESYTRGFDVWGTGCFFISKDSQYPTKIRKNYETELKKQCDRFYDYTWSESKLDVHSSDRKPPHINASIFKLGIPLLHKNIYVLSQKTVPVGILHFYSKCWVMRQEINPRYYFPTIDHEAFDSGDFCQHHTKLSQMLFQGKSHPIPTAYDKNISLRFRVWPWRDKREIKSKILHLI